MRRFAELLHFVHAHIRVAVLAAACLAAGGAGTARQQSAVLAARLGVHDEATRFVVEADSKFSFSLFTLADPYRVVLDMGALDWRAGTAKPARRGLVGAYRYGLFRPGEGRLVLDLTAPAAVKSRAWIPPREGHQWRLVIELAPVKREVFLRTAGWPSAKPAKADVAQASGPRDTLKAAPPPQPEHKPAPELAAIAPAPAAPVPVAPPMPPPGVSEGENGGAGSGLPVIVIDPGHGGVDPGASASDGTFEKDVVLAVAKVLVDALNATGRYEVHLTRADDTFLKLKARVDVARHSHADLFISLHADALSSQPQVGGLSVYTLSETASDTEAEALASKENRADVIAGVDLTAEPDDVTMILIDLAQRETMNRSIQLAHGIGDALQGDTRMVKNGIRQAGFRVLKAPDVCSVLIELGYLSNAADLERLKSEAWRARFAADLTGAIDRHFDLYGEQRSAARP